MKCLLIIFILFTFTSYGQVNSDTTKLLNQTICYVEHFDFKEDPVFIQIESPPYYKGGSDAFLNFLLSHIDLNSIVSNLKQNERLYSDTATVKFILSKRGVVSDLTIVGTKKEIFRQELFKIIFQSSCYWIPGNFSGRFVNGWISLKIYYTIERRQQSISTKVGFNTIN